MMAGFGPQGALFLIFGGAHYIFNYLNNIFQHQALYLATSRGSALNPRKHPHHTPDASDSDEEFTLEMQKLYDMNRQAGNSENFYK